MCVNLTGLTKIKVMKREGKKKGQCSGDDDGEEKNYLQMVMGEGVVNKI